jgi:hypothetical protein
VRQKNGKCIVTTVTGSIEVMFVLFLPCLHPKQNINSKHNTSEADSSSYRGFGSMPGSDCQFLVALIFRGEK